MRRADVRRRVRHRSSRAFRSGSSSRTGSAPRRKARRVSPAMKATCAGSLRWRKVPRPESFADDVGAGGEALHACAPRCEPSGVRSSSMPACCRTKVTLGQAIGELRRPRHLAGEDLEIETPAIVRKPRDVALQDADRARDRATARNDRAGCRASGAASGRRAQRMARRSDASSCRPDVLREHVGIGDDRDAASLSRRADSATNRTSSSARSGAQFACT